MTAAVVNAERDGYNLADTARFYEARLRSVLRDNLASALRYYREARFSSAWNGELDQLAFGAKKLARAIPHRKFILQGTKLAQLA
jgi:hypothetical protein